MGKPLFVSSTRSLLQFVVVDLISKVGFDSLHGREWLHPLLHPLSRYWLVVDLAVERKMTLKYFLVSLK